MTKFDKTLMEKAKAAKSAGELLEAAKANGAEISAEQAQAYFDKLNVSGELADDELGDVSGGGCA